MAHISENELVRKLDEAAKRIEVGARYAHYKNSEHVYSVTSLALLEANLEVAVIYRAEYGKHHPLFIRPLVSFLEEVEVDGVKVPRFRKL